MRKWLSNCVFLSGAMVAPLLLASTPATAQTAGTKSAYSVPRTPDGKPDLQGIWEARNTANDDLQDHGGSYGIKPGLSVVVGGAIPYKPEALAKKTENFKNRETADPMSRCFLAGMPRTMYIPDPFQVLQTPQAVVMVSQYVDTWRWIPTYDLKRYDALDSWSGDPRGRWEGDTLVVESTGFNDQTWFDHAGNYHSDQMKLTERFTRTAADVITYEATIDDPIVFSRPWTIRMPLYKRTDLTRILENECFMYADEAGKGVHDTPPGNSSMKGSQK